MQWVTLAAMLLLAGCGGRVVLTAANPHAVELLVQNANFVPVHEVEDRALRHCADYGLVPRQTRSDWVDATSMTFRFECEDTRKPVAERLAEKKVIKPASPHQAAAASSPAERKQAAWNHANAMSPGWVKCVLDGASRMGRASSENADTAAISVTAGCSRWEHDINEVLRQAGEQDGEFQADLHRQVVEFAAAKITSVRATALVPQTDNHGMTPAAERGVEAF